MCGVLGVFKKEKLDKALIRTQIKSITHRGPDHEGVWFNESGNVGLGSRRLAIQDLSANGHMPMISKDGRHVIVFNGEIYNHFDIRRELQQLGNAFASHSDTETVLYAYKEWGVECLERLNGMFAIAIFDNAKQEFFLARDRAGEKPLYYWQHSNGFSFASELKQLFIDDMLPRKLNKKALKNYLENGFIGGKESFIENVFKLPPAHYLKFNFAKPNVEISKYWEIPAFQENSDSKEDLVNRLDELLGAAVKRQMISDVPLGVLLSGGVDSSLITAYASEHKSNLKTFHISFDGFGKYNEAAYAKKVADYFDTNHIELSGNDIEFDMIDEALNSYDEPLADSSMLPTMLVSKLTRQHVTVALGGDGGDELFGGYLPYSLLQRKQSIFEKIPNFAKKLVSNYAQRLPTGYRGRNYLMGIYGNERYRFFNRSFLDSFTIKKIIQPSFYNEYLRGDQPFIPEKTEDFLYDITKHDFQNYLAEDILIKVDRSSMAHSLEVRSPFLDKELVNFAFSSIPGHYKATGNETKILPKILLKKRLPIAFDVDRKQGFSIPLNDWISSKWYNNFIDEVNNFPLFFNKSEILKICKNIKKGYQYSPQLFALLILSKWIKKYNVVD